MTANPVTARLAQWRHRRLLARMAGPRILAALARERPEAVFVEIGSNDGEHHDHLRSFIVASRWQGVMVEPVPYIFERLRSNYEGIERVALENAAIADADGTLPFFHVRDATPQERAGLPDWYDGIGSFSREMVLRHAHGIADIEERIVQTQVQALTFESLRARHGLDHVDLLLVDTEGYDYEILRGIDLAAVKPRLVVYEHFHLSADDRRACREHMRQLGYTPMEEGFDTWCMDLRPDDVLTRAWTTLEPAVAGVTVRDERR